MPYFFFLFFLEGFLTRYPLQLETKIPYPLLKIDNLPLNGPFIEARILE